MTYQVLLISTYELGRQPFGLASPAAWLRRAGVTVRCLDLAVEPLSREAIQWAELVAFYLPMHMATRMAVPLIERVRQANPAAQLCCYGLYAPVNASFLRELGVETILGGEYESGLVALVERLKQESECCPPHVPRQEEGKIDPLPVISLDRQQFLVPDRGNLPGLSQYARLVTGDGEARLVGYTEASRGCKHLCRHCPIVPVYGGRFRIVQLDVVLADIRQQVTAGAQHITFGDPDFFNGPGHALPLVEALHREFPGLTYDVTIKVEHLLKHARHLPTLQATGCLFITTAVESFDERILTYFDKRHTLAEFEAVLTTCREIGLTLIPTFVAFTPWTTLAGYGHFLGEIARLDLVKQVPPVQYTLRLLIPPGSRLLDLPAVRSITGPLDQARLSYQWQNDDPRVDHLQQVIERLVHRANRASLSRPEIFQQIWAQVQAALNRTEPIPISNWPVPQNSVPRLSEPWYC